jgi:hypothetical protein
VRSCTHPAPNGAALSAELALVDPALAAARARAAVAAVLDR